MNTTTMSKTSETSPLCCPSRRSMQPLITLTKKAHYATTLHLLKKHGHCANCGPPSSSQPGVPRPRSLWEREAWSRCRGREKGGIIQTARALLCRACATGRRQRRRHFAAAAVLTEKATGIRLIALHQRQDRPDLRDFSAQRGGASLLIVSICTARRGRQSSSGGGSSVR